MVMFPEMTERHARNEDTTMILRKCLMIVGLVSLAASVLCGFFPRFVLYILCGKVYPECVSLVIPFSISMTFYALNNVFLYYHLSAQRHNPVYLFLVFAVLQTLGIIIFHNSLLQVVNIVCAMSLFLFLCNQFVVLWKPGERRAVGI
jgi:hypothetical protein